MNVCMLAYTFYESDNRVRRYAEALVRRGDKVDAIVLRREGQVEFEVVAGVNVYRIQQRVRDEKGPLSYLAKLLAFFFRSAWVVTRRHLKARYKVIHVHSVPDFQIFAAAIPKLMGARIILDIHDIIPEFYASKFKVDEQSLTFRILLLTERISVSYADHVIIANHLWYKTLTERSVPPAKCTAIINYPDPSMFYPRPRSARAEGEFVMCYPGTLNWHQGLDVAIRAVALAKNDEPGMKLLIIGDGPDRATLQELIKEQQLDGRVVMTGSVSLEQVAERLGGVDLGVVPKRKNSFGNEAFSTKIMEFMATGIPVLASDTKIDQYYFNDTLLQFFKSGDIEQCAQSMIDLARDPNRRNGMRERGLEFIKTNNWDVKKHEYFDLIDLLVASRNC